MRKPVLVVPACEKGRGGGHFIRSMSLVRELRELGREAWLFISAPASAGGLVSASRFNPGWIIGETGVRDFNWECVILDRFETPREEFSRWAALAPVIGIDEGGPCRNRFDFLIDILPGISRKPGFHKPNIFDPSLLPLPEKKEKREEIKNKNDKNIFNILISFGQEDSAGLGSAAAKALAKMNNGSLDITLLMGGLSQQNSGHALSGSAIKILDSIPKLSERLCEYDLIITHYGLTAFESLYAGTPVVLVSPTPYHERLAKAAGFFSAGVGKGKAKKIARMLFSNNEINFSFLSELKCRCTGLAARHNLVDQPKQTFAQLIDRFSPMVSRNCPACGGAFPARKVLARFPERTYRRCSRCGTIIMERLNHPPIEYGKEYFFESYQKQYGKTYIEDFPNLTSMAQRRLAIIKKIMEKKKDGILRPPSLLDIGCAYGPFLAAAREKGFSPYGIDPAEDAVRYVAQTLGIPAEQGFFPGPRSPVPDPPYLVITLWYVIEHFADCVPALAEINKLLPPGGVLAFATPSFSGISGRSSLKAFLHNSPADHWTIWSPAACKKALTAAGFKVKKRIVCGHHPERFPLLGKYAASKRNPLHKLLLAISKIFGLGDTFEVYAIKVIGKYKNICP